MTPSLLSTQTPLRLLGTRCGIARDILDDYALFSKRFRVKEKAEKVKNGKTGCHDEECQLTCPKGMWIVVEMVMFRSYIVVGYQDALRM
jgi:hypothetical protein